MDEVSIKSLEDARRYREELCARKPETAPGPVIWRVCKRWCLCVLLAAFALIYYLIAVNVEVLSLPETTVVAKISTLGITK